MPSFEIGSNVFHLYVPLKVDRSIGVGVSAPTCGIDVCAQREFDPKYTPLQMFDFASVSGKEMSCSSDGKVIAIGKDQTSVMVYHRINNRWTPLTVTIQDDLPSNTYRGSLYASKAVAEGALSYDGTRLAIVKGAAPAQKNGNVIEIYHFENNAWVRKSHLHQSGAFGWSVALSGDGNTLVASSPLNPFATSVFVYKYDAGTDSWALSLNRDYVEWCGTVAVNFDGTVVAICNNLQDPSTQDFLAPSSTNIHIVSFANGEWSRPEDSVLLPSPSGTIAWHNFGKLMRFSKDSSTLVVGAPGSAALRGSISAKNAVYVYKNNMGVWEKQPPYPLMLANGATDNLFGSSFAVNDSGNLIVVGAPLETVNGSEGAGCAYVFQNESGWNLAGTMHRAENRKSFALSLSLAKDTLYVMADKGNLTWGAIQYKFVNPKVALSVDGHTKVTGDMYVSGDLYKSGGLLNLNTDGSNVYVPLGGSLGIGTTPGSYSLNVSTGSSSIFHDSLYVATNRNTRLGVGLANPMAKFHVKGDALMEGDASVTNHMHFSSSLYGADNTKQIYITRGESIHTMNHLALHANANIADSGVAFTSQDNTHMFVKANSGFIGMGTLWPQEKLHVVGNTKIEGDVMVSGNITAQVIDDLKALILAQEERIATLENKLAAMKK